jgi:hypothetical protein
MNYEIRKLSFEDGVAAEELVRQVFHSKSRLSLRHAPNLFNFYRFLSAHDQFADVNFWGAFRDPQTMTGLTGFVNYELQLDVPGMKCFYNSDSLVLPDHTGRGVYLKLLDRQTDFFNSLECIPLSWGIEHHPGKLNGMKTYLEKRGGMVVRFLGHTRAFNVFIHQPMQAPAYEKIFLKDLPRAERAEFLGHVLECRKESVFYPSIDVARFDRLLEIDPQAHVIRMSGEQGESGLVVANMHSLRQYYKGHEPAGARHWSMFWSRSRDELVLQKLFAAAYESARIEGASLAVVRDIPLSVAKLFREVTLEPRRIFAVTRKRDQALFSDLEKRAGLIELDALFV